MKSERNREHRAFAAGSAGQGLVEYALILALVVVVVVAALLLTGHSLSGAYRDVNRAIAGDVTVEAPTATVEASPTPASSPTPENTPTPVADEWRQYGVYSRGDLVMYRGVLYRCLQSHTAYAPNWIPPLTPALWDPVT